MPKYDRPTPEQETELRARLDGPAAISYDEDSPWCQEHGHSGLLVGSVCGICDRLVAGDPRFAEALRVAHAPDGTYRGGEIVATTSGIGHLIGEQDGGYLVRLLGAGDAYSFSPEQVALAGDEIPAVAETKAEIAVVEEKLAETDEPSECAICVPGQCDGPGCPGWLGIEPGTLVVTPDGLGTFESIDDDGGYVVTVGEGLAIGYPAGDVKPAFEPSERISFSVVGLLTAGRTKSEERAISEAVAGINRTEESIRDLAFAIREDLEVVADAILGGNQVGRDAPLGRRAPDFDRAVALRDVYWATLAGLIAPAVVSALAARNAS